MRAACYLPGDFWDEIIKRWDPIDLCNRKHGFIRYSVPKRKRGGITQLPDGFAFDQ